MYKTIIQDCQSINAELSCGDCIAYPSCELFKQKSRHPGDNALSLN